MCYVSRNTIYSKNVVLCLLLAVFFVFGGQQELRAAEATSGKFVFEYCHSNAAWGHRLNGFFIDNEGDVWKYDHSAERWQPSRSDGIFYEFDLKEKYRDATVGLAMDKAALFRMRDYMARPKSSGGRNRSETQLTNRFTPTASRCVNCA